jgi:two-component system OmpR family response regulator
MASKPFSVVKSGQAGQTGQVRHRLRLLIADDDRDTTLMLAAVLRDEGDEVHVVLRGDEVLEVVRLFRPDATILDVNMPGMSGYGIAREIRDRYGNLSPLLIAISGVWTSASDRLAGKELGFDHYLVKPCDPAHLIALLEPLRSGLSKTGHGER